MDSKQLIDSFLENFFDGQIEKALALFAEDFKFDIKVPCANRSYHLRKGNSRAQFRRWLEGGAEVEFHEFDVRDIGPANER